ncbi:hypothetical protein PspLS_06780 [Pyricularia sp. CBS 133598]|nr:hypothetical protein PspLS_06780 [Pyricularia sp. CBS 133598]
MPRSTTQGRDSLEPEALTPDLAPVFRQFLYEHFRSWRADGSSPTPTLGAARAESSDVMASTTSTATPIKHSFDARVSAVRSPKSDINAVILDYLTMEGYPKAAANFAKEANIPAQQDVVSIIARREIQNQIHQGQISDAIDGLNDLDPEILGNDPKLHFELLRLQLVELIRTSSHGDIEKVIKFAQEQLAPRAPANEKFIKELESTMSLLFFDKNDLPENLRHLLHPDLRRLVAEMVNKAVLELQTQRREAAIRNLVRLRTWAESTARQRKVELPAHIALGFRVEKDSRDMTDDHAADHDSELMVT